jgi:hypothetical protein
VHRLTARALNRATLARQLLLGRVVIDVVDAIGRIVAVQAQEPASPYLALWNRVARFDPADLDRAFAGYSVIKATLMRTTLHAVAADDYRPMHTALAAMLRAGRLSDPRFTALAVPADEVDAVVAELAGFAVRPRTNAEFDAAVEARIGARPKPGLWWALRTFAPFVHAPTGRPWSFGPRPAYVAAAAVHSPGTRALTPEAARQRLVRRYLSGFGPAALADIAGFTRLPRAPLRQAVEALAGELVRRPGPDGTELFDVPDGPVPDADTPAPPRLMAMWDSVLLAYADRGRVIPHEYRRTIIRPNGDVLPTLLVDGYVAGVWRPTDGGIEATAFRALPDQSWAGLADEARALVGFLADREPLVYRRYQRWWASLPGSPDGAEVRLLPG